MGNDGVRDEDYAPLDSRAPTPIYIPFLIYLGTKISEEL
jgi:hypothetical protein